jgi:hypothetical protein
MKPGISMITLGVRDLAASVRFCEQGEVPYNPHFWIGPRDGDG